MRNYRNCLTGIAVLIALCLSLPENGRAQTCTGNAIICENALPGNTGWDVAGSGDATIQGFATDISVNLGQTINFKIQTPASSYRIDIYRIGYYGGAGARKIASVTPSATLPQTQPACLTDSATNLMDCGNWAVSASWQVPSTVVSGLYVADLIRSDTGGASPIFFVVRNDASHSDLLFQTSDETWQAYNNYGGHSLYGDTGFNLPNRAYKVSYNRPYNTRTFEAATFLFNAEYPMIRWLEANGYDVTYFTGVDAARNGSLIQNHKVYLSVGHDEYWSGPHRGSVEAARDAGVNLAFFSGNEVFWKTRWENSLGGSGTPYRTLVCYKETLAGGPSGGIRDPLDPPTWTGTWRDPTLSPPADGGRPENALTGTLFMVNGPGTDNTNLSIQVPAADGKMRFWRSTTIASLTAGQIATLPAGTLGYEWDADVDNGFRPAGTIPLSTATYTLTTDLLLDYGGVYGAGTATHRMTMHRAASGALVFGAGTVQWAWGLDANHDGASAPTDVRMQQATVNLFADMGVQPGSLQSGLLPQTKSTDTSPPSSTITAPAGGTVLQLGVSLTITGTAVDFGGGVVGGVEVSTDGGTTWHAATGRETWSYSWTPLTWGTPNIRSRAVDDSGNLETPTPGVPVTIPKPPINSDVSVSTDNPSASTTVKSPAFSTAAGNELLLAFVATDYLGGANTTVTGVTGGGLTWTLVKRTNAQSGTSEIWRAFATAQVSNVTVTAALSQAVASSITVMSFSGVDTTGTGGSGAIGATASGSAATGAPTAKLTTTRASSIVLGVGNDYDNAIARTPAASQSIVHQYLTPTGDTLWVQMVNIPIPTSGTSVTFSDTAPTGDRYNLSIVEVLPAVVTGPTYSISGTVSPVPAVAGATVALSGASTGSTTADSTGAFSFGGLANGTYTITPSKTGYSFSPQSQTVTVSGANISGVGFTATALPTFSASGAVTPLPAGTSVTLTLSGAASGTAVSDSSGLFTFSALLNGSYTVTPSKTGYNFSPTSLNFSVAGNNVTGLNFTAQPAPANIQLVQANVAGNEATGSSMSVGFTSANTAGNLLVVVGAASSPSTTLSISDTAGNTYQLAMGPVSSATQNANLYMWYAPNCKGGANTVKITPATATALELHVAEFTNGDPIAPLDQISSATGNGTAVSSGAKTTTVNGELIYGYGFVGAPSSSVGSGFTGASYVNGDWDEYEIQSAPGSVAATFTQTSASWMALMATFRPVGAVRSAISGTISPAAGGTGATVTLSGTASATTSADSSGNYSFSGLVNGNYTVTPTNSGYAFSPSSQSVVVSNANVTGVNFTATPTVAVLSVAPAYLVFSAASGSNPAAQNVSIANTGNGSMTFTASSDAAWLTPTPATGTAPQTLQLAASTAGLAVGAYTGHITITASGAQGSPATVTVILNVGSTGDWLMVDHDPGRSGNAFDEPTLNASNVAGLKLSWTATVDGSVVAQPLFIHGAQITGQTKDAVVVATGGNSIFALDASNGAVLWKRNFGASTPSTYGLPDGFGIEAPPVIDRATGRIYTVSTDGSFHTIALADGTDVYATLPLITNPVTNKVWGGLNKVGNSIYIATGSNGGDVAPWRGQVYQIDVSAAPTLVGNFVVVPSIPAPNGGGGIWGYGGVSADLISGNIYAASAFDSNVGSNGNEGTTPYADSVIALSSHLGLLGYYQAPQPSNYPCGGAPCDLDFAGTPIVFQPLGCPTMTAVGNKNGNLYLFKTSDLIASGQPLQILTLNNPYDSIGLGGIAGVPAFSPADNMLFIVDAGSGVTGVAAGIVGLNVTANCTLQVAWSNKMGTANDTPNSTPTVANGVVFVGEGTTGIVHAFNTKTGTELWHSGTDYKAVATFGAPIVALGKVYAGSWSSLSGGGIVGAFALSVSYSLSGSVTPAATGAGTVLTLSGGASGTATADASGNYSFANLANGTYTVTPAKSGYTFSPASQTVTVNGASVGSVSFTITPVPTWTISGSVTPASSGTGTVLTLSGAAGGTATADASGNYSFANLANGTYTVTPAKSGYTFSPASQTVTVNGASVGSVSFTITPAATWTISGSVTPASSGTGTVLTLSGAASGTATADASGNYSFANLANGTYTVTPSKSGYTFSPASQTVTVNGASVGSVSFTITPVPTWTISGSVTPASSGSGTVLTLSGAASGTATADASGNYSFANLANGTYTVTPAKSGYTFSPASRTVTVNGANVTAVSFTSSSGTAGNLARDVNLSADRTSAATTVVSPAFTTQSGNELLLAFVSTDYLSGANTTVTGVTGGGLTWVLVLRSNTQSGSSEIWRAFAPSVLTNVTVTATLSQSVMSSITVMSFTGVDTSGTNGSGAIGATKAASAASGAPTVSLVTTRNNSWVFGVGNDYDNAIARTPGSGQTVVHQDLTSAGDTYWVQMQNNVTPTSGTTVSINDTAPTTDRYNLAICEILPHP